MADRSRPLPGRVVFLSTVALAMLTAAACLVVPPLARADERAGRGAPDEAVGNLNGTFAVNGNGAATYELPLIVPPGTGGLTPDITLAYNHRRDAGYLGMGWAIHGISAITRCGATIRLDGFKGGVAFDERDRFCIDGQRLIAVSGPNGADGTRYHTERERWSVFTSHGECGNGPCSFTAVNRDGTRLTFGVTAGKTGSRVPAQGRTDGTVRTWSVDSFEDPNGNRVSVSYANDPSSGEYYPTRIDYTANQRTGLEASRSIRLTYEDRPDETTRYLAGSRIRITKRLKAVTTTVRNEDVLTYRLRYDQSPATGRSRLTSLQLCDAEGTCRPETAFTWSTGAPKFDEPETSLPGPLYAIVDGISYPAGVLTDIDGDGIPDYAPASDLPGGDRDLTVYLGRADGGYEKASFALPGPLFRITNETVVRTGLLHDVNADGLLDYSPALRNDDAGTEDFTVHLGTGQGFDAQADYELPGPVFRQVDGHTFRTGVLADMNGDGIPDYSRATLLAASGQRLLDIYEGTGEGFDATGAQLPGPLFIVDRRRSRQAGLLRDLNGDGLPDYSAATRNEDSGTSDLLVYLGRSPDFGFTPAFDLPGPMFWVVDGHALETGVLVDVNGDGIPDYSRATELEGSGEELLDVHLGTGAGYTKAVFRLPGPVYSVWNDGGQLRSDVQGLLSSLDGDGMARYSPASRFGSGRSELALYVGDARGFRPAGYDLPGPLFRVLREGVYGNGIFQDLNGDDVTDYAESVCVVRPGGVFDDCKLDVSLGAGPFSDLLTSVTNGFGGSVSIEYAPLSSDVYELQGKADYPLRQARGTMYVVRRSTNSDGRGDRYVYDYEYRDGFIDLIGQGWLGFGEVTTVEEASGRRSTIYYRRDYPFNGLAEASEIRSGDGALLTHTDFTYSDIAPQELLSLGVHQVVRTSESLTHYSAGTADYTLRQEFAHDTYGNVTIVADLGDTATGDDDVFSCVRYLNDEEAGAIGYVEQEKVTRTRAACEAFIAASPDEITWKPDTDLRWNKLTYDENLNVIEDATYDDSHGGFATLRYSVDAYGNVVEATGPAGFTTRLEYDDVFHTFLSKAISPAMRRADGETYSLVRRYEYDPRFGLLRRVTDPNGNVFKQRYDGFGRLVAVLGPGPSADDVVLLRAGWGRDETGIYHETRMRLTWEGGDPAGWYWVRSYTDGIGRKFRTESRGIKDGDPAPIVSRVFFDDQGRIEKEWAPHFAGDPPPTYTFEYDEYNRPVLTTEPSGVKVKIDYAGGGLKITRTRAYQTPEATSTVTFYTARGLTRRKVQPNGLTLDYTYDPLGRLLRIETSPDPRATRVRYDSLGRVRSVEDTNTGTTTWTYDTSGHLRRITDASGNVVSFDGYDALGRLTERTMSFPGGTARARMRYDEPTFANAQGKLTTVEMQQEPLGSWSYAFGYDAYGDARAVRTTIAGETYVYGASYTPARQWSEIIYPDGSILSHEYAKDGLLRTLALQEPADAEPTPYAIFSRYTALGQVLDATYGNGLTIERRHYGPGEAYPNVKRDAVSLPDSGTFVSRTYRWNALTSLTAIEDLLSPEASETFSYDDQNLNRDMEFLTGARGPYGDLSYRYDRLGNVTRRGETTFDYVPGTDRLQSGPEGTTYAYYDNGYLKEVRRAGNPVSSYRYDAAGNLIEVARHGGASGDADPGVFVYDYDGRRVYARPIGGRATYWISDYFEVVERADGTFQHTKYVPGPLGNVAAVTRSGRPAAGLLKPAAIHRVLAGLHNDATPWGAIQSGVHRGAAALASAPRALWPAIAMIAGLVLGWTALRRRHPAAVAPRDRSESASVRWSWRRLAKRSLSVLLILSLLVHPVSPAMASLEPGPNGFGVPSEGILYFVQDILGSTTTATSEDGGVTARVSYLPYGSIDQDHSTGVDNFRAKFTGKEWHRGEDLYFFGDRYYDPTYGRFISPDPLLQFTSPYLYAADSPLTYIDPNGDAAIMAAIIIGTVVGAYFGAAAVNHDFNPAHWDWESGKTYAGLFVGAGIGSVGAAAGGAIAEAGIALGSMGGAAAQATGIAVGIAGEALVGAAENAAFTALGGGSSEEILQGAFEGAAFGGIFGAAGQGLARTVRGFGRRADALNEVGGRRARAREGGLAAGFRRSCASFVPGTGVLVEGGARPIEELRPGDRVYARNLETGDDEFRAVTDIHRRVAHDFVTITLEDGTRVEVTADHMFRLYERGWVPAKALGRGDLLTGVDGDAVAVVRAERHRGEDGRTVHNLTVDGYHNYFVSSAGVLVKNGRYCSANLTKQGVYVESWDESALRKRFPQKSELSAVKRDIRAKARNANKMVNKGLKPWTRVNNPVKPASKQWVRGTWKRSKIKGAMPTSTRQALGTIRKNFKKFKQDVDEYVSRVQGGLTIREGMPRNQGPLIAFVNSTSGAAAGKIARGPRRRIFGYRAVIK